MNDFFNIKRFIALFKKLFFERRLQFIGSFILAILLSWFMYKGGGNINRGWGNNQDFAFSFSLILCGTYWVSVATSYFSTKEEGYSYLTLPASHFEKWLTIVGVFILFCFCYGVFFRTMDTLYYNLYTNHHPIEKVNQGDKPYQILSFFDNLILNITYVFFFNLTAAMAVGGLYFNKMALVKTALFMIAIFLIFMQIHGFIASSLIDRDTQTNLFWRGYGIEENGERIYLNLPKSFQNINNWLYIAVMPTLFWGIAYVRMTEKEI